MYNGRNVAREITVYLVVLRMLTKKFVAVGPTDILTISHGNKNGVNES